MSKRRYGCFLAMEPTDEDRDQAFVDATWMIRGAFRGDLTSELEDLFAYAEAAQDRTEKIARVAVFLHALAVSNLRAEKGKYGTVFAKTTELIDVADAHMTLAPQEAGRGDAMYALTTSIKAIRARLE